MEQTKSDIAALSKFKTKPLDHQLNCLNIFGRRQYYALNGEMGTGKTWIIINEVADLWGSGDCDGLIVVAPNGVHSNWTRIELLKHMPSWVRYQAAAWTASPKKAEREQLARLFGAVDSTELRIFTVNWEALQNKKGQEALVKFARSCRKLFIAADESDNMKNPKAQRTQFMFKLKPFSHYRRTMSGTPINNGPFDAFSQYNWLDESILHCTSFTAFKSEYAELLQEGHPLLDAIKKKLGGRYTPQVVAKDRSGRPRYRNLEQLSNLIAPHTFRVLKKDCLDLPEKIYKTVFFEMTAEQRRIYDKAYEENRLTLDGQDTPFNKLVAQQKLSQITSGYYIHPDSDDAVRIDGENPKLSITVDRVKQIAEQGNKVIIWARYHVQIQDIVHELKLENLKVVEYHGKVKKDDRTLAIDSFERGDADVFVGQQQAGGSGITLVAASYVVYFSNDFSYRNRAQSEDRAHRIGQTKNVTYIDMVAKDSVDEEIVKALTMKEDVALQINDRNNTLK
jgi:SNF2 family DNA or RNA helicase